MKDRFEFERFGINLKTEIIAGITSFLAMMYIIIVNPAILNTAGMPFNGVLTATIIVSAFSSIAMGWYANNPILLAPGMGLNAFFTYSVVLGMNVPWQTALGAVFWSGIVFLLLSIVNVRTYIVKAIPKQLRFAIAAGIGIFISISGLINSGFIVTAGATPLARGNLQIEVLIFLAGLILTSVLVLKNVRAALIIGILVTTLLCLPVGRFWGNEILVEWTGLISLPDFSLLFALDLVGSLHWAVFPVMFAFLFTDMFDSLSTFVGVAEAGQLIDSEGEPRNIKKSLIVDGMATVLAGITGSSPGTSYIESAAGIEEGGRTGLTAIVGGLLFLPFLFFSPLLSSIPKLATAPVLVLVGIFMMRPANKINWFNFDDAFPAFLAMILIPLTYSITQGIIWGFLSWTIMKLFSGKKDQISPMLIIIDIFCILALVI